MAAVEGAPSSASDDALRIPTTDTAEGPEIAASSSAESGDNAAHLVPGSASTVALVTADEAEISAPAEPTRQPSAADEGEDLGPAEQEELELRCRAHVQHIFEKKGKVDEASTEVVCECLRRRHIRSAVAHELNMMRSKASDTTPQHTPSHSAKRHVTARA